MNQPSLRRVERAARKAALARQELEDAVRESRASFPLREIAKAANMSHEQVRRLTQ